MAPVVEENLEQLDLQHGLPLPARVFLTASWRGEIAVWRTKIRWIDGLLAETTDPLPPPSTSNYVCDEERIPMAGKRLSPSCWDKAPSRSKVF